MLEVHHLSYLFAKKVVLEDIHFTFKPGHLYAVLGANGAGKTTFFKVVTALLKPSTGEVFWCGENIYKKRRVEISQIFSLMPQCTPLPFHFTAKALVEMGRYCHGKSKNDEKIVESALEQVDALHLKNHLVTHLSQGERQRIFLARALATKAPVLLLDEPSANLDVKQQLQLWSLLRWYSKQGNIVLVALHDLQAARSFCDFSLLFSKGRCIGGESSKIVTSSLIQHAFQLSKEASNNLLGEKNERKIDRLV